MNLSTARRSAIRAALTSSGMRPARRTEIKPACGYYMGASSSPTFVLVLSVSDDMVRFCDSYSLAVQTQARWIFEDLVCTARETLVRAAEQSRIAAESADVSTAMGRRTKQIAEVCAGNLALHGAPVCLSNYDRYEVRVMGAPGVDVYGIGKSYGVVGNCDDAANVVNVECSDEDMCAMLAREGVTKVAARLVKACPKA